MRFTCLSSRQSTQVSSPSTVYVGSLSTVGCAVCLVHDLIDHLVSLANSYFKHLSQGYWRMTLGDLYTHNRNEGKFNVESR